MASKGYAVLDVQNDEDELEFQDFEMGGKNTQTHVFTDYPDSPGHQGAQDKKMEFQQNRSSEKLPEDSNKSKKRKRNIIPSINPVLNESISAGNVLIDVLVMRIQDKKHLSKIVSMLAKHFPVGELRHLKRLYKRKCSNRIESINSQDETEESQDCFFIYIDTLESLLTSDCIKSDIARDADLPVLTDEGVNVNLCKIFDEEVTKVLRDKIMTVGIDLKYFTENEYFISKVSKYPPRIKQHYDEACKFWPSTFHQDFYLTKMCSGNIFNDKEIENIGDYITKSLESSQASSEQPDYVTTLENPCKNSSCIIVNPDTNSVVSEARWCNQSHPLAHSAMVAVDKVGAKLGGGAWSLDNDKVVTDQYKSGSVGEGTSEINASGGYICTAFDVYLSIEPCMMCAMVLLHSRVQRVFFCHTNAANGALKSKLRLHTLPNINHRYDVFHVTFHNQSDENAISG